MLIDSLKTTRVCQKGDVNMESRMALKNCTCKQVDEVDTRMAGRIAPSHLATVLTFVRGLKTCKRIRLVSKNCKWSMELIRVNPKALSTKRIQVIIRLFPNIVTRRVHDFERLNKIKSLPKTITSLVVDELFDTEIESGCPSERTNKYLPPVTEIISRNFTVPDIAVFPAIQRLNLYWIPGPFIPDHRLAVVRVTTDNGDNIDSPFGE